MKIVLIRHSMTIANEKHIYCGKTDLPLSENGIAEIKRLKSLNIYPSADLVITSGMKRTDETAKIIYGRIDKIVPSLREFTFGEFELKGYEDLKEDENYLNWIMDKTGDVCCPDGECKNDFTNRVFDGFNDIISEFNHKEMIAIITHGGVISALMEKLFNEDFFEIKPEPGRGYLIDLSKKIYEKIEG